MSFTDFIAIQDDVAHALLSDPWLNNVNVITRHKLIADGSRLPDQTLAAEVLAYLTERNGRRGCGIIVEKPRFTTSLENVPGPQGVLTVTCLVLEDILENEAADTGTLIPADQVAQRILDIGHLWTIEGVGILRAAANGIEDAPDWQPLNAYRANLVINSNRGQTNRVARVSITTTDGLTAMTTTTDGAFTYYTIDETPPGPSNPGAILYTAPVAFTAGTIVRAAAFHTDLTQSPIARKTI